MIDSIGFIEDLNPILLKAFHTTLNELANSDLILLFVDGSEEIDTVIRQVSASHKVMQSEVSGVPVLICLNKIDIIQSERLDKVRSEISKIFGNEEILEISAKTGMNIPELLRKVTERLTVTVAGT